MGKRLNNNLLAVSTVEKLPYFSLSEELGEQQSTPELIEKVTHPVGAFFGSKKEYKMFAQQLQKKYAPTVNEGNSYLLDAFLAHADKAADALLDSLPQDKVAINKQLEALKARGSSTEDEEERRRIRAEYASLDRMSKKFSTAPFEVALQQVLLDEIFIDGLAYCLVARNDKVMIHENIYELMAKLAEKYQVRIRVLPVHKKSIAIANEKDLPLAELVLNPQNFPPKISLFDIEKAEDVSSIMVVVNFLKGNVPSETVIYPVSFLLNMAKRVLSNGQVYSFYTKGGQTIVQKYPLSGPWNGGCSDFVEMLKKTALRNVLKTLR